MAEPRPRASREEVEQSIRAIRAYHQQGRAIFQEVPRGASHDRGEIAALARRLGWDPTKTYKARQFGDPENGYSRDRLNELCRLLRDYRPIFGTAHAGVLVSVSWAEGRAELQRLCTEENWGKAQLKAEVKARLGRRRVGGRRPHVAADDPVHALIQLDGLADSWLRWHAIAAEEPAGNGRGKSVLDRLPEGVRDEVRKVNRAMRRLREAVAGELERARARRQRTGRR